MTSNHKLLCKVLHVDCQFDRKVDDHRVGWHRIIVSSYHRIIVNSRPSSSHLVMHLAVCVCVWVCHVSCVGGCVGVCVSVCLCVWVGGRMGVGAGLSSLSVFLSVCLLSFSFHSLLPAPAPHPPQPTSIHECLLHAHTDDNRSSVCGWHRCGLLNPAARQSRLSSSVRRLRTPTRASTRPPPHTHTHLAHSSPLLFTLHHSYDEEDLKVAFDYRESGAAGYTNTDGQEFTAYV